MDQRRRYMSDTSQLPHDNDDDHSKEATTMFQFSSTHPQT